MGSLALFENPAGRGFAIDRNVAGEVPTVEALTSTKKVQQQGSRLMFEIFQINNRHAPGEAPSLREIHPTAIDKDGDEGSADW